MREREKDSKQLKISQIVVVVVVKIFNLGFLEEITDLLFI